VGLKVLFSRLGVEFDSQEVAPRPSFPAEINSAFQLANKFRSAYELAEKQEYFRSSCRETAMRRLEQ